MAWAAGDRFGPYDILTPLGPGAFGQVFRARDTRRDGDVRLVIAEGRLPQAFEQQAGAIAALDHPHICAIQEIGPDFIAYAWVDGVPLKGPLSVAETLRFAGEICGALVYAHQRGLVHGALSASNVLVTPGGVKLLDFGLGRIAGEGAAPQDACAAPEQRAGQAADQRSDIYAFGCLLYEMLMGRAAAENRRPVQPPALEAVLHKCLAADPERRWQSAGELKTALDDLLKGRGYRREYLIAAASVVMLIAGMVLLVMQFPSAQKLSAQDRLVLGDFTNTTGDVIFDGTLRAALEAQLAQSPLLKTVDAKQVQQDLKLMGRPPDTRITNAVAHDICMREGQKAAINGAIADAGKVFVITLQAVGCKNGATLARQQVEAEGREQVLRALTRAAAGLLGRLSGAPVSLPALQQELQHVTSTSLEAFQAYARGLAQQRAGNNPAAAAFFQRAIALDENFGLAYIALGRTWAQAGDPVKARTAYDAYIARAQKNGAGASLLRQAQDEVSMLR